jgi:hypothetical protein
MLLNQSQNSHRIAAAAVTMFTVSLSLILFELLLTRLFGVILFAHFAHLALGLAMLGISIGAVIQHLFPKIIVLKNLESRLALIVLLMGGSMLAAVICAILFPVVNQFAEPPVIYQERSSVRGALINIPWFSLLLPILAAPFVFAGIAFSGTFFRLKRQIGLLYGADLIGGAVGAVLFIPLLKLLAAPDVVFVAMMAIFGSAAFLLFEAKRRWLFITSTALFAGALSAAVVGAFGNEILKVKYAAGYSERNITYTEWTPLTRLAVHEDARGKYLLLDNSSASEILLTEKDVIRKSRELNRSFVYKLHKPPARVAILASSAGPEVAIAQHHGFTNIDAIDIAGEIGNLMRHRYPQNPVNPFLKSGTRQIKADGRAAVMHAKKPYDIIQMVHANLHSNAGLLANVWSPSLLETKEAFSTYLDHLSKDGTLSFGRGSFTPYLARSAAAALKSKRRKAPWRHIIYIKASVNFILGKKRPWQRSEVQQVKVLAKQHHGRLFWNPEEKPNDRAIFMFFDKGLLTDNKPYLDHIRNLSRVVPKLLSTNRKKTDAAFKSLYSAIFIQIVFLALMGLLFIGLPLLRRAKTGLLAVNRVGTGLLFVTCLGYGYLSVETVLIHELVLFVGHPTYAVTVVIMSMLLFSGLGSIVAGIISPKRLSQYLQIVLFSVLVLGALQAWVVPELLYKYALGLETIHRLVITFFVLAPLGFAMGMPFPLAMRIVPERASAIVPWAWALNGWMSVAGSIATVVISRVEGYTQAFGVAIFAYFIAFVLAPRLMGIGRTVIYEEQ